MDKLANIYNTMLIGISYIATTLSVSLGLVTPARPAAIYKPSESIFVLPTNAPETTKSVDSPSFTSFNSPTSTNLITITPTSVRYVPTNSPVPAYVYKLTYFDIDAATDNRFVTPMPADPARAATIQQILNTARIKPSLVENYAIVFNSDSGGTAKSGGTTVYKTDKPIPIPEIGPEENGKLNDFHKYILIRGTLRGTELAQVYLHEVGHITANALTAGQFKSFMQTRGMSTALMNSWYDFYERHQEGMPAMDYANWTASPGEDFAEVFRYIYGGEAQPVKTKFGVVSAATKQWFTATINSIAVR